MKKRIFGGVLFGALFAGFTYLVRTYQTGNIGPGGTTVGFWKINSKVHDFTGVNMQWYELTEMLGILALAVAAFFALAGLIQLIRRRSLFKVDREIISLGILYAVVIAFYFGFEKIVINYRPVLMDGALYPEPSYPSSHTMLICVVMGSAMMLAKKYLKKGFFRSVIRAVLGIVIALTVFGRLYCGVHWFTDIVGGLLLSASLLEFYSATTHVKRETGYQAKH